MVRPGKASGSAGGGAPAAAGGRPPPRRHRPTSGGGRVVSALSVLRTLARVSELGRRGWSGVADVPCSKRKMLQPPLTRGDEGQAASPPGRHVFLRSFSSRAEMFVC
ncbi:hypothetical protein VPH35_115356 [Triticum aestivum]